MPGDISAQKWNIFCGITLWELNEKTRKLDDYNINWNGRRGRGEDMKKHKTIFGKLEDYLNLGKKLLPK